jgi:tryptophanyl-tRNA synthetase
MRPTGRLHLGNYFGALKNWVELQNTHDCYFCVVDWHMLTTGYEDTSSLQENMQEMVLDWLAAGLDPKKCVIFKQSSVPEHAELALLLGMVTPLSWLENNPTWKEQLQELAKTKGGVLLSADGASSGRNEAAQHELRTSGFLNYPVLQAADILLYNGTKVPVGQDQLPHVELSREIARRFNNFFPEIFTEPQALLTPTPKVSGMDGRKMSKSYANAIDLFETEESLKKKTSAMYTDPTKIKVTDPGHPEPCPENLPGCSVFALHKLYAEKDFVENRRQECRAGKIGCVACKKDLLSEMQEPFAKFRETRARFTQDPGFVQKILDEGADKARAVAKETMERVRHAMRLRP